MPDAEGEWAFGTSSNARSLDGIAGTFSCSRPRPAHTDRCGWTTVPLPPRRRHALPPARHHRLRLDAPGRRAAGADAAHARAARRSPSCACASSPSRTCYNANEPERYPFEGSLEAGSTSRGRPRVLAPPRAAHRATSGELGIEADLILFHAYDRWGFADMGRGGRRPLRALRRRPARRVPERLVGAGERVRPAVVQGRGRLGALRRVDRRDDPYGHLRSSTTACASSTTSRPWVTHASMQRVDVYRTAENTRPNGAANGASPS